LEWPDGYASCFCLRVDIDTVKDARSSSSILSLLGETEIKATFFVTTGPDDAAKDLPRAAAGIGKKRYLMRYGFDGLRGLLLPSLDVEGQLDAWREIVGQGHEIALHGYWHRRWMRSASDWGRDETLRAVGEGARRFASAFPFKPKGFAAPGFRTNESLPSILGEMGFEYSSNTRAEGAFKPEGACAKGTLEIPVSGRDMGELMLDGSTEGEALGIVGGLAERAYLEGGLFCYYVHPAFEVKYCEESFRRLLMRHADGKAWTPTLSEAADWLRKNGDA